MVHSLWHIHSCLYYRNIHCWHYILATGLFKQEAWKRTWCCIAGLVLSSLNMPHFVSKTLFYTDHILSYVNCLLIIYAKTQCEEIGKENEEEKSSVPLEWHHRPPWCFLITLFSRYWQCPLCWFVLVINQTHWWVTLCFKWHWWQWQWSERGYDRMLTTNGPEYNLNKLLANCPITRSTFWHNHYQ